MKYLGTSFSLTLGAWRLRFSFDVEDAPDERAGPDVHRYVRQAEASASVR